MRTILALMAMSLAATAACGGNADTNAAAADSGPAVAEPAQSRTRSLTGVDACSLLTGDEVRAILGQDAKGEPDADPIFDLSCSWYSMGPPGTRESVSVEVDQLSASSLREAYDAFKTTIMTFREDVNGVGTEAFLAQYSLAGSSLVFRTDNLLVFINTTESGRDEMLKKLGPTVLGRLR